MAERLKAPVLKTGKGATSSWVRIPPHPRFSRFRKGLGRVSLEAPDAARRWATSFLGVLS